MPTTDLPIHSVPALLHWFNRAMATRLAPLLGPHFGFEPATLRVHDAFVVKYREDEQKLLPFHTDESLYSLTIALNDRDEYSGGGTYFADLRSSISVPAGHVVAFEGSLFHSGAPVIKGTRYIIAAFLYIESENEKSQAPTDTTTCKPGDGDCKRQRTAMRSLFAAAPMDRGNGVGKSVGEHPNAVTSSASGFTFNF